MPAIGARLEAGERSEGLRVHRKGYVKVKRKMQAETDRVEIEIMSKKHYTKTL